MSANTDTEVAIRGEGEVVEGRQPPGGVPRAGKAEAQRAHNAPARNATPYSTIDCLSDLTDVLCLYYKRKPHSMYKYRNESTS